MTTGFPYLANSNLYGTALTHGHEVGWGSSRGEAGHCHKTPTKSVTLGVITMLTRTTAALDRSLVGDVFSGRTHKPRLITKADKQGVSPEKSQRTRD